MAKLLADQLKKAFAEAGMPMPGKNPPAALSDTGRIGGRGSKKTQSNQPSKTQWESVRTAQSIGKMPFVGAEHHQARRTSKPVPEKSLPAQQVALEPSYSQALCSKSKSQPQPNADIEIKLDESPTVTVAYDELTVVAPDLSSLRFGQECQCAGAEAATDERELVLGLDFGTSSTKVVIGDRAAGKAFAVPFTYQTSVMRYLLPCRLYQTDDVFSLAEGEGVHRDLKLALAATPADGDCQTRVVAFLALVLRLARGWLLTEHKDIYSNVKIIWHLAIGLPVAHQLSSELVDVFKQVALVAWVASVNPSPVMSSTLIESARSRAQDLTAGVEDWPEGTEVEVDAVPEIAAQIYGFVNSHSFDRNARNVYLIVDVGAGTVDSSLFHVKAGRGGKWDFEFFTSVVEPHGVMNLHSHRVVWWQTQLGRLGCQKSKDLQSAFDAAKFHTDRVASIPEDVDSYVSGAVISRHQPKVCPDNSFFNKLVVQVRGRTYWQAFKSGHLGQNDLRDIPAFYCGGGLRMKYYQKLKQELTHFPGCTWLKAHPKQIALPEDLNAPGLKRDDYDRLSVAYGLSFINVGKIVRSIPAPRLASVQEHSYQDRYISKDSV